MRWATSLSVAIVAMACALPWRRPADVALAPTPAEPAIAYPSLLRTANVEGTVSILVHVDAAGRVDLNAMRVERATHALFAAELRNELAHWQFRAARRDGRPVGDSLRVRAQFVLEDGPHCPQPPPCSAKDVAIPAATMTVNRDSLPAILAIRIVSCPQPPHYFCVPSARETAD